MVIHVATTMLLLLLSLLCASGAEIDKLKAQCTAYDESLSLEGSAAAEIVQSDNVTRGVPPPLEEPTEDEEDIYFDGAEVGDVDEDAENDQGWS